jgi:ribonuclease P protein component
MKLTPLSGDKAFDRLRKGKNARGRLVSVRWLPWYRPRLKDKEGKPIAQEPMVRIGIVVSKKVGKAVVRNKVRRRIREMVRRMHLPQCELVVTAQPQAAEATFQELLKDLSHCLRKSGLLN